MLVIQLFWHSEHAYTTHLNYLQTVRKKNTGNRTLGDTYGTGTRKTEIIQCEYEAYSYKQIGSWDCVTYCTSLEYSI